MFKRIHPFTSLAVILLAAGPVAALSGFPAVAAAVLVVAHGFVWLEFKKYTSHFQFGMMVLTATALGILLDLRHSTWPLLTFSLLLASTGGIARQAFMQRFTYVNLLWADTGLALTGLALYLLAIHGAAFSVDLWLAPIIPIAAPLLLTAGYVQDAQRIRKSTRFGYRVQPGMQAIDFELPDQDGNLVKLSSFQGKHPVLLIFVRGDWCPGCHMMLRTYERNRQRFMEKDVHVVAVGPDDIEVNRDMVERIGVRYRMLSDSTQHVSDRYGVVYSNPVLEAGIDYAQGIPLPASFLIDASGVVRYVSRPDRVGEFLDPTLIFGVLDQLPTATVPAWN
jgi:peroxiredoxin